jgi:hypothetical protein
MDEPKGRNQSAVLEAVNPKQELSRSTGGISRSLTAPDSAKGSTRRREPSVQPSPQVTRSKDEWVINESTRNLYLSLFAENEVKNRGGQVKPAPVPPNGTRTPNLKPPPDKASSQSFIPTIALDMGSESTSRFTLCAALLILFAAFIYKAISWSGGAPTPPTRPHQALQSNQRTQPTKNMRPAGTGAESLASEAADATITETAMTLIPTVILDAGQPSQSSTHTLVVHNRTPYELDFSIEAKDLVSRDGKPVYLPGGEAPDSVAGAMVFSTRTLDVKPMQSSSLDVTLNMPVRTTVRGVVVLLNSRVSMAQGSKGSVTVSLGSFITWPSSPGGEDPPVGDITATATAGSSLSISQWMVDQPQACPGVESSISPHGESAVKNDNGGVSE